MPEVHNVDSVLTQVIAQQLSGTAEPPPVVPKVEHDQAPAEPDKEPPAEPPVDQAAEPEVSHETPKATEPAAETGNKEATAADGDKASPIDEYGNPLAPPKMYSEDEVQRMIRDRLSRGRHAEQQPTKQEVNQAAKDFKADPASEEPWEQQLETFIEKTIEKKQAKAAEQQWRQQEAARQAEFESKFTSGMTKYGDFHQVVAGKPITDGIMLATRSLDNPAAFVYGAAKLHPQELERIAKINDPLIQATEVGRLHERMVKERKLVSTAPKPLEVPRGDIAPKAPTGPSIEDRIAQYAKQKRK